MAHKKYAKTLGEAKAVFKKQTGVDYDRLNPHYSQIRIFTLKKPFKTATRKYYIGTYIDYINR